MRTDNDTLITELLEITERATNSARRLRSLDERTLNHKEHEDRWSILECIEHLNLYGDYYLPEIEKALSSGGTSRVFFKSGLLGGFFARLMRSRNGKITPMKSPVDKDPTGDDLSSLNIDRFLKQQELLTSLLKQARSSDLTGTKVPISIARFVRLRLGDTLRFFVYHIERHIFQAERAEQKASPRPVR